MPMLRAENAAAPPAEPSLGARIRRILPRLRRHAGWLGYPQALRCTLLAWWRHGSATRVKLGETRLVIRAGTSDLEVVASLLLHGELDGIRCDGPRVIVDAGAHIGVSALALARRFPRATIFALEPERANFELLVRNTAHLANVVPLQLALWGREEERIIFDRLTGPWGYSVLPNGGAGNRGGPTDQLVQCTTLDALSRRFRFEAIDILKLDIEGAEKEVLERSIQWAGRIRVLVVELHDRICPGATDAFNAFCRGFSTVERAGEKVVAYR